VSTKYNVNERNVFSFLSVQISDLKLTWWYEQNTSEKQTTNVFHLLRNDREYTQEGLNLTRRKKWCFHMYLQI